LKIVLLCGGISPERDISLASGKNVAHALRSKNYEVCVIDPAYGSDQPGEETIFSFSIKTEAPKTNNREVFAQRKYIEAVQNVIPDDASLVFVALHGTWGEDGKIQALLEFRGIPYTGSGVLASALAMDKLVSKWIFKECGIQTPPWITIRKNYELQFVTSEIDRQFGYPVVVKPTNQGSTVGMAIVQNDTLIQDAIETAFRFSDTIIIEMYVPGREITVSILDGKALPIIEIRPREGYYDYKSKYTAGMTEYLVPAPLDDNLTKQFQDIATRAFTVLGCKGFGRVDFRLNETGEVYCLEANTIPGLTNTSLVPKAARAIGIEFGELCEQIALDALKR
jgi:D-alanine-D-alanine ligase